MNPTRQTICLGIGVAFALAQFSCVGPRRPSPGGESPFSAQPGFPQWLTGDLATCFAGANGFKALLEIQMTGHAAPDSRPPIKGELRGLDGNLLFTPEWKQQRGGPPGMAAGGISFLWNCQSNAAFVLNEPMQAYAPANASPTGATRETVALGSEAMEGQQCQKWRVVCSSADGTINVLTIWRAGGLNDLPVRIQAGSGSSTVTLVLSRITSRPLSSGVFSVPDGFTRYVSLEDMMTEFMARQRPMMPGRMGELPGAMPGGPGGRPPRGGGPPSGY